MIEPFGRKHVFAFVWLEHANSPVFFFYHSWHRNVISRPKTQMLDGVRSYHNNYLIIMVMIMVTVMPIIMVMVMVLVITITMNMVMNMTLER